MNFIRHLLDWVDRFKDDDRLSPAHLALYFVLFHEWNRRGFISPFPVLRDQMMGLTKIRSPNVYTRCIKELDHWGYIRYEPSFNQWEASQVHLFQFNKRNLRPKEDPVDSAAFERKPEPRRAYDLYENKGIDNGTDNATDNGTDKGAITASIPFNINELNNNTNQTNLINTHEPRHKNSTFSNGGRTPDNPETDRTHLDQERQTGKRRARGTPRNVEEVKTFFAKKKASLTQAELFYNYYQSLGWKMGKLHKPVEDWRYTAKIWIINNNKNENDNEPLTLRPGASQVRLNKNYDQPL